MPPFRCSGWSMKHGPRDRHNRCWPELHPPSPSPWKGEGVRQRGSCTNETEHCAIAMHIAGGVQTSFVISIIPYGPRDRHKRWSVRTPSPFPFPLERGRGASKRIEHQQNRALRDRVAHSQGAQTGFVISIIPYGPRDRHNRWSVRTPSPVPFPLERGRGASKRIVHQRNIALRDRDANSKGVQTGFVISIIPYGPRDRHKTLVGACKRDLQFRCFSPCCCSYQCRASTKPSIARSRCT